MRLYLLTIVVSFTSLAMFGQRIVEVPASINPNEPTDLTDAIMGDTMLNGDRVDNNTVYSLANGADYVVSFALDNDFSWPLQIEATNLTQTNQVEKPKIYRVPDVNGTYHPLIWSHGDVTLKNLWIINAEKSPGDQFDWGRCRFFGHRAKLIVDDCIMEKDRGGFLQLRADSMRVYVNRCIFRNGGLRFILEGDGRAIDTRQYAVDTLIVRNTTIHNLQDRVFRSRGNVIPHNYIEFDHCTIFNIVGRNGCFVFEQAHGIKITNNLMCNPMMLGASPHYSDQQNNPDGNVNKIFTLDVLVNPTNVTISNNNIFWTQDVLDLWAQHDTVSRPPIYSTLITLAMGGDTSGGHFEETLSLNNVPINITEYVDDLLADPESVQMFDIIVQDSSAQGTDRDFDNLFDFLGSSDGQGDFDPFYNVSSTLSGSGATDGGPVGVRRDCLNPGTLTWLGNVGEWNATSEWDGLFNPNQCTDLVVPSGQLTLVPGSIGRGRTLQVDLGARLTVELGAEMEIR